MENLILIAYATKHGATAGIAERIGEVLHAEGWQVHVTPIDQAGDLSAYRAVVLGSAVYAGEWRKEAAKFLEANEKQLANLPVWLFSSGPTGSGNPVQLMKGWRFPEPLQPIADRIHPRDIAFFHGDLDLNKLGMAEKLLVRGIKAPLGDFRDWDAIASWSRTIASELNTAVAHPELKR
jgi:menaquinone-dependent protoporphyrinogen oxidase